MTISSGEAERIADAYTKAWNSGSPEAVASFYAVDGSIVINNGDPWEGRSAVAAMAAGFYADVPDIHVVCEQLRYAGDHLAYLWRFTGTHSGTKNRRTSSGGKNGTWTRITRSSHRAAGSTRRSMHGRLRAARLLRRSPA